MLTRELPPESRTHTAIRGALHWPIEAHLLDDLRMTWVGTKEKPAKPHPSRPTGTANKAMTPEHRQKLRAAQERAARRRADLARLEGGDT